MPTPLMRHFKKILAEAPGGGGCAVSPRSAKWEMLMPGQWVLSLPGDAMAAMVTEGLPGRWLWQAQGKDGTAASKEAAIAAAEAHLPNHMLGYPHENIRKP